MAPAASGRELQKAVTSLLDAAASYARFSVALVGSDLRDNVIRYLPTNGPYIPMVFEAVAIGHFLANVRDEPIRVVFREKLFARMRRQRWTLRHRQLIDSYLEALDLAPVDSVTSVRTTALWILNTLMRPDLCEPLATPFEPKEPQIQKMQYVVQRLGSNRVRSILRRPYGDLA